MKLSKFFITLLIITFIFYVKNNFYSAPLVINSSQLADPKQTIILWDLHGVVFEKKLSTVFNIIWNYDHKLEILQNLNGPLIKLMGNFFLQLLRFTQQEVTSEELIATAHNANNNALVELALQVSAAYYPTKEVISIIKELNNLGYKQDIGSNIGATVFKKFKEKYSTIFSYFTHNYVVHYYPGKTVIKKPNKKYFINYLHDYAINPKHVIFIDDKIANIQAARSVGMHAIHFKTPIQLRSALQDLGISLVPIKTKYIEQYG